MGLDIGVVKLDYLQRPEKTTCGFARHLGLKVIVGERR